MMETIFNICLAVCAVLITALIVFRAFLYLRSLLFPVPPQLADRTPTEEKADGTRHRICFNGLYYTIERYSWLPQIEKNVWCKLGWRQLKGNPEARKEPLLGQYHDQMKRDIFTIATMERAKAIVDWEVNEKSKYPEYTYYPPEHHIMARGPVCPSPPEKNSMVKYKFRAECMDDIKALCLIMKGDYVIIPDNILLDAEVQLITTLTRPELIALMRTIPDGHVMYQTIQPLESYTGERDYSI